MCTPAPVSGTPLHQHGAFDDLAVSLRLLSLAAEALKGIGKLMQPHQLSTDEQLNCVMRSEAASVFEFFGEALAEPCSIAGEAADRLHYEARQLTQGDRPC